MPVRTRSVLALRATNAPVEQLGLVISWRLSEVRNRVLEATESVEALYVIDPAGALPSTQLADRLRLYEKSQHYDKQKAQEILRYSTIRTLSVYCGYWDLAKLHFVSHVEDIGDQKYETVDYRREIQIIMGKKERIDAEGGTVEDRRRELAQTLSEIVLPEFDRLEVGISTIEDNTKAIEADTKVIRSEQSEQGATLRQIAEKLGIPRP